MALRSALRQARGLGSAKEGAHHWWLQRLTAIALIPLTLWFVVSLIGLAGTGYEEFLYWFDKPVNASLMILLLGIGFYHAQIGMLVVFEDYVSDHAVRTVLIIITKFTCYGLATLSIVSILTIAFRG